MRRAVAAGAALALLAAGCSASGGSGGGPTASSGGGLSGAITVYAASSLTEAFDTLKARFEKSHPGTHLTISYGASSDLATQIDNGAPVDVFASASTTNMQQVKTVGHATDFVTNTMEIATPPGNPAHITAVRDLAAPGVKVAVCDPAVPCGAVAQQVLDNAKVTVHPTAREADVKSTLAAVESGEVDAGMVYVTDVRAAGKQVHGVPIPAGVNARTAYPIATLTTSKNPSLAKAFVAYVLSPEGTKVLLADGFSKP